ncbi:MAG: AAA family ATPase [Tenericutes bacterium]|nr:MAG: AAA family ATPase [Mycoplasmatota bacterium]
MITDRHKTLMNCLKQLHLPTVRERFVEEADHALQESLSHEEYLLSLMEQELEERKVKRVARYLRESKLPLEKTLEVFDRSRLTEVENRKVEALLDGRFLARCENVLAFGGPGGGKTHLLAAIGIELIHKGYRVRFYTCSLLVQELLIAKRDMKLARFLKKLSNYDLLIIDDIGYVQQSREEMEVLFTLLANKYERGSVMLTSNLQFSEWEKIFKDPMTTAAAIDRLVHHSVILELNLPSFRLEESKKDKNVIQKP